jgi:nicotinic acid mononucleotide adenylyltransferase
VAFFPGTFDPFSVSHKEIATNVRDLGFQVYLGIDEFSWSKRTLPHQLRKNIVSMSIAGEENIYIYPEDYPVNIGNSHNLMSLKNNFRNSQVAIVVGSDVILNASAYKNKTKDFSINNFNHIVFDRNHILTCKDQGLKFKKACENIDGTVEIISLMTPFEEVSSTQIRTNIDKNRDISTLIDPLAQRYIYENGFYRSEPQYKSPTGKLTYDIQVIKDFSKELIDELCSLFEDDYESSRMNLIKALKKTSARIVTLRLIHDNYSLLGFSIHHLCRIHGLHEDLNNPRVSEYIREKSRGKIALIDGIIIDKFKAFEKVEQILFTETLSYCLSKDYEYGIYKNLINKKIPRTVHNTLVLQGFKRLNLGDIKNPPYVVNMACPISFYADIRTVIKNPFKHNPNIKAKIDKSRKNLRKALTGLYEENLVITFDRKVLHDILIKKICKENNVEPIQFNKAKLGAAMCVSFGNMLNQSIIPNTVTKAMHTEKMFYPDMKEYFIGPFPYYNDLDIQVKMIKSFNRPIILIDDILHKGYRNNVIHPLLQKHNVKVQKTIVGLLSARGRELMYRQKRNVDSAYYIPKLKAWFNESLILPFFGGDTIWRGKIPLRNLTPSVNLILPYTWPAFIKGASRQSIYNLSKTCIESSIDILSEIESIYHKLYKRRLSLSSLGEVFISPRCIDYGVDMSYDLNLNPSHYLYNDLDKLERYYKMFF